MNKKVGMIISSMEFRNYFLNNKMVGISCLFIKLDDMKGV